MSIRNKYEGQMDDWELPENALEVHGDIPDDLEIDVYVDAQVLIQSYIDSSSDVEELESIIDYTVFRLRTILEDQQNPGRASEWDVLGDK